MDGDPEGDRRGGSVGRGGEGRSGWNCRVLLMEKPEAESPERVGSEGMCVQS